MEQQACNGCTFPWPSAHLTPLRPEATRIYTSSVHLCGLSAQTVISSWVSSRGFTAVFPTSVVGPKGLERRHVSCRRSSLQKPMHMPDGRSCPAAQQAEKLSSVLTWQTENSEFQYSNVGHTECLRGCVSGSCNYRINQTFARDRVVFKHVHCYMIAQLVFVPKSTEECVLLKLI